jgi:hypothetical protein
LDALSRRRVDDHIRGVDIDLLVTSDQAIANLARKRPRSSCSDLLLGLFST